MSNAIRGYLGVIPCLLYSNPSAAADWIAQVLGFRESPRCAEQCRCAAGQVELERRDGAILVLGRSDTSWRGTRSHTRVIVDDVDDTCLRALCAGGAVERGPTDEPSALVSDPEGNRWELVPAPV
ncbi:VOC family protein [Pseudonocardia endophytica]|uniref:Glyoxalase-like domain-containing protein n=1 Tax=Pseudonocardia endophytica TaxID=401976 RepID=A0A4R1HEW0_PSEEN|nr:VOC family protein [Pseudonocardia endophytica]TCK20158.1 hypothetical protein EV378_4108 [Pseudonocardia endophytica]